MHATQFRSRLCALIHASDFFCAARSSAMPESSICVPIDRRDAPRRELLVDGRTAFDNNLIRKIQRQRAERADLRPALKDAVRAHIAVPAAVEQNVPVRALDEIG